MTNWFPCHLNDIQLLTGETFFPETDPWFQYSFWHAKSTAAKCRNISSWIFTGHQQNADFIIIIIIIIGTTALCEPWPS
jgi:hypothetical protein